MVAIAKTNLEQAVMWAIQRLLHKRTLIDSLYVSNDKGLWQS